MDRFVAMIWDQDDHSRQSQVNSWSGTLQRQSPKWIRVLDQPGLRVFSYQHRGGGPIVTRWQGENGIVIGVLFERGQENKGRILNFERRQADRIASTRGNKLIKNYWGNYVALWRDPEKRQTSVLRDPCGAVPCFMTDSHRVDILFSHTDDVADFEAREFEVDWNYLRAFVVYNYFITANTGLERVKEVLPGQRLSWRTGGAKRLEWLWNGAAIAANQSATSFAKRASELRAVSEACFAAWGSEYRRPIVSVSGGFDSSVLVSLLRHVSDARILGLHYKSQGYEQYEVKLARLAAQHAGVKLVEADLDPGRERIRRILEEPRMARPKVQVLGVLIDDLSIELAAREGADGFMIGQGGDNLFLQAGGTGRTLGDYLSRHGVGPKLAAIAYDAAVLQQRPVWAMLSEALRGRRDSWKAFGFLNDKDWAKHRPFPADVLSQIPKSYIEHPWLGEAASLPAGKADHLLNVMALYNYYTDHLRGVERDVVYPFLSQPIMEMALQTPTFVLCEGGRDRALARAAFADIIPDEIARRTAKGGADAYFLGVMKQNLSFYRELALEGELVNQGWIDRAKLERALSPNYLVHGGGALFVYLLVTAEAWLRTWRRSSARVAA